MAAKFARLSILALACAVSGAYAQDAKSQEASAGINEIVVTARRVEERLQDAPVSIAAFSAETLERAAIQNINDLTNFTSNMTFSSGETGRIAAPVLRGIGIIDTRGFDNSVGIFIDGAFVSGRAVQNVGMLDLERVEVIKGPQSALYGRNTFAGAINYITRKPSKELSGRLEGTLGSDDLRRALAIISGPFSDRVSGRLAIAYDDNNGTYRNAGPLAAGEPIGGSVDKSVLATLRFEPSDTSSITLTGYFNDTFGQNRANSVVPNNCGFIEGGPGYYCGEIPAVASDGIIAVSPDAYGWDGESKRGTLDMQWDFDRFSIQSLSSYTQTKNLSKTDLDRGQTGEGGYGFAPLAVYQAFGSPSFICSGFIPAGPCSPAAMGGTAPLFNQIRPGTFNTYIGGTGLDSSYWSTELRFSSPRDQRFRWLAGLFYFESENNDTTQFAVDASSAVTALNGLPTNQIQFFLLQPFAVIPGLAPMGIAIPSPALPNQAYVNGTAMQTLTANTLEDKQAALFVSADFDFTNQLTGTAELRYTTEKQVLDNYLDIFFFSPAVKYDDKSTFVDPRFILRYKPTENLMFYGSAAKGSRSGGLNPAVSDPSAQSYDPEKNNTFEIGTKTSWLNNRLTFNAAVFYIDWTDAQFRQNVPGNATLTVTRNAGDIESKGFELELMAQLGDDWSASLGYGYADSSFGDGALSIGDRALCTATPPAGSPIPAIPLNCVQFGVNPSTQAPLLAPDISGLQLRRTSKHTATATLQYSRPAFGDWDFTGRFDAGYRSKQYHDFLNNQYSPGRVLANLRFGLESDSYDVTLWMENLTNEDSIDSTQTFSSNLNSRSLVTTAVNIPQRRYGLTARYRF
ncbi:MAG TPA: TonB-dependent receptor [Steroidobacteraceae bacterium]|nr:TonB-dependent receptor [Steroidobacteraceae bacterium]HRX88006.1 TonB-dependent receptor [Steroidobacteraceae bacterium]